MVNIINGTTILFKWQVANALPSKDDEIVHGSITYLVTRRSWDTDGYTLNIYVSVI